MRTFNSQVSKILSIIESFDPTKTESQVYTNATGRYLIEGHHTTIAVTMLERNSGFNMNTPTNEPPEVWDYHWTKKWYEFGKKIVRVLD